MNALVRAIKAAPFVGKLMDPLRSEPTVTEGISGLWHYHLSSKEQMSKGLSNCGASVMMSNIALSDWRKPFGDHFPKRPTFCAKCAESTVLQPDAAQIKK